jgi:hypothetical protein
VQEGWIATPLDPDGFSGRPYPAPGVRVVSRHGDAPPYLVVEERLDNVLVLEWPIRLWRVTAIDAAADQVAGSGYVRATAFTVVEEVDARVVFGPNGAEVAAIVDRASRLSADEAGLLAAAHDPGSAAIVDRAWDRFLAVVDRRGRRSLSPVGPGLTLVERGVIAAASLAGAAFELDEEDGVEVLADPTWQAARHAAMSATLAVGAPQLLDEAERQVLVAPWALLSAGRGTGRGN